MEQGLRRSHRSVGVSSCSLSSLVSTCAIGHLKQYHGSRFHTWFSGCTLSRSLSLRTALDTLHLMFLGEKCLNFSFYYFLRLGQRPGEQCNWTGRQMSGSGYALSTCYTSGRVVGIGNMAWGEIESFQSRSLHFWEKETDSNDTNE